MLSTVLAFLKTDLGLAFVALASSLVTLIITLAVREHLARKREEREYDKWQTSNLGTFYYDEYLTDDIKKVRRAITGTPEYPLDDVSKNYNTISNALQRVGSLVYIGAVPLSYALIMNAYQIVTDWLLVVDHVDTVRGTTSRGSDKSWLATAPYHRRHAEWLALVCWLWISTQDYKTNDVVSERFLEFKAFFGGRKAILEREKLLYEYEETLANSRTDSLRTRIRRRHSWYLRLFAAIARFFDS